MVSSRLSGPAMILRRLCAGLALYALLSPVFPGPDRPHGHPGPDGVLLAPGPPGGERLARAASASPVDPSRPCLACLHARSTLACLQGPIPQGRPVALAVESPAPIPPPPPAPLIRSANLRAPPASDNPAA
jgi:hypothetical protein